MKKREKNLDVEHMKNSIKKYDLVIDLKEEPHFKSKEEIFSNKDSLEVFLN
jgi:hypothetical protein